MNIFLDTAVKGCNIALFDDLKILAVAQEDIERGHAETLLPLYQDMMERAGASASDIENIFVTVGPGSFTGLRVGLTVARFIGFSLGRPVHGVTTFQAFSAGLDNEVNDRMVVVETKRSDYYCQMFNAGHKAISEAQSLPMDDVLKMIDNHSDLILTGDAVVRFVTESGRGDLSILSQPMINVEKTVKAIQEKLFIPHSADAFYIRDADVSMPKANKL